MKKKRMVMMIFLIGFLFFGTLAQAGDIPRLDVPFFSQSYGDWAGDHITETKTISNIGCMMTAFSMILKYYGVNTDPGEFNDWLQVYGGYNGEILLWNPNVQYYAATQNITVTPGSLIAINTEQDDQVIRSELLASRPVIVKVQVPILNSNPPRTSDHWMVVVEEKNNEFYCWDPLAPNSAETRPVTFYGVDYEKYLKVQGIVPNINHFTFPNHFSEGWTTGFDTEIFNGGNDADGFNVHITGPNPGIVSPSFTPGTMADQMTIKFSAKVLGNDGYSAQAMMYIKDQTGNWDHPVSIGAIATDQEYHEYTVDLSGYLLPSNLEIRQFSLEFTNWEAGGDEYWFIHWLKIYSESHHWDFTNSALSWKIKKDLQFADFFVNEFWRMESTGDKPQIISPYFDNVSGDYTNFGIRYSVNGNGATAMSRIYYDVGNGFDPSCSSESSIVMNNALQTVLFNIPTCARGTMKQVLIDLFDCTGCSGNHIAVNNIGFLLTGTNDGSEFFLAVSQESELPPPLPIEETVPPSPEETCSPPQNMSVSVNGNKLTLTWENSNDQVLDYEIQIWENNGGMVNSLAALSSPFSYEEPALVSNTDYKIIGKTYCGNTLSSSWSNPIFFHTIPTPIILDIIIR